MFPRRPGRIRGFSYIGFHRYSVTICTHLRKPIFEDRCAVASVLLTIRQCSAVFGFAVPAYCFMPDHLHLVITATTDASDFQRFMSNWKQRSGYEFKRRTRQPLWQESYFDHVLRDDDETKTAVKYVLENPVRKGMVTGFEDYPYSGSDVYGALELRDLWQVRQG